LPGAAGFSPLLTHILGLSNGFAALEV